MKLEITFLDTLYRCADCEHVSESALEEPLYQCIKCEKKLAEDRCEDCNRKAKRIAKVRCESCDAGEVEKTESGGVRCDRCNEVFEAGSDKLQDHVKECFAEDIDEALAQDAMKSDRPRVPAIECPYCRKLVRDSVEDFEAHMADDCADDELVDDRDQYAMEAIEEAEREANAKAASEEGKKS